MAQTEAAENEKPPGGSLLNLIEKQHIVSLDKFPQKEAFLVGKNIFNSHVDKIEVQVVTDIKSCKYLFNNFSPQNSIFDEWEFRYAWYLGYKHTPCFFIVYYNKKPIGLLPLWYEGDKNQFRWFGSYWMEDNTFWVFHKKHILLMLSICPPRTYLNAIPLDPSNLNNVLKLEADDAKFFLDLTKTSSLDDYLARFNKKQRYNLKRDIKIINNQEPKIIINRLSDIESFFQLSNKRFGNESDCISPKRRNTYKLLIRRARNYQRRIITIEIGNQIASVDLVFLYKNTYYAARGANNIVQFPGIGNFVNFYQIQEAIKMGYKKIDFLQDECNWKAKMLQEVPLHFFRKNLTNEEVNLEC